MAAGAGAQTVKWMVRGISVRKTADKEMPPHRQEGRHRTEKHLKNSKMFRFIGQ